MYNIKVMSILVILYGSDVFLQQDAENIIGQIMGSMKKFTGKWKQTGELH